MTLSPLRELEREIADFLEQETSPELDTVARWHTALLTAMGDCVMVKVATDEVLVALRRPEGYEDVHAELVSEDAIREEWPEYRTIAAPVAAGEGESE